MTRLAPLASLAASAVISLAACSGSAASPAPDETLDLRAWTTQALPPAATFATGPVLVIADDRLFMPGPVPAIFPGPLLTPYQVQTITPVGQAALVDLARQLGLLGSKTDFTQAQLAGGVTAHVLIRVGEDETEIVGDPNATMQCVTTPCEPEPGTPEAFGAFWTQLSDLGTFLGGELESEQQVYEPERLAVLVTAEPPEQADLPQPPMAWPLDRPLDEVGAPFPGSATERCFVAEGDDLTALLPAVRQANQLTPWRDATGAERGLVVRVLLPGEPDPCAGVVED